MKKGFLSIVLFAFLLCAGAFFFGKTTAHAGDHVHCICGSPTATAEESRGHICTLTSDWLPVDSEETLVSYLQDYDTETNVYLYLTAGFTTTAPLTIGKNEHLYLCLNGQVLTIGANLQGFLVGSSDDSDRNAALTLSDCSAGHAGAVQGSEWTDTSKYAVGGSVVVKGGTFTAYDVTIRGGRAEGGANLYFNNGTAALYGVTLEDGARGGKDQSSARYGGNLHASGNSRITLEDCTVQNGRCMNGKTSGYGGNIAVLNTSELTAKNTVISGGQASTGGNLFIYNNAKLTLSNCTVTGGRAETFVNASGGTIGGFGGNICIYGTETTNPEVVIREGSLIQGGSTNSRAGGNICLYNGGTLTVNNSSVVDGSVPSGLHGGISAYGTVPATIRLVDATVSNNTTGVYAAVGKVYLSGNMYVRGNIGDDMLIRGTAELIVEAPLTYGADSVGITMPLNTPFGTSETDESNAFYTNYSANGAEIVYDSVAKTHKIVKDGYTDFTTITPAEAATKEIYVYIIAGQSNAAGQSTYGSAQAADRDLTMYSKIHFWSHLILPDGSVQTAANTTYPAITEGFGNDVGYIGPELGIARKLQTIYEAYPEREVVIFKYAAGGTSILGHVTDYTVDGEGKKTAVWSQTNANTPKYGTWYCGEETEKGLEFDSSENRLTGYLYRGFQASFTEFYQDLRSKGFTAENIHLVDLFWLQGESDRPSPDAYRTMFADLLAGFRNCFYTNTGKEEDLHLPVIVNEISSTFASATASSVLTNWQFIEMQRSLTGVLENYSVIPSASYRINQVIGGVNTAVGSDSSHYKYADALAIGEMLGTAALYPDAYPAHTHCDCVYDQEIGDHTTHEHHVYSAIGNAEELIAAGQTPGEHFYYLSNNIELTSRVNMNTDGVIMHLCLNGHYILGAGNAAVFGMNTGASTTVTVSLTITDCASSESSGSIGQPMNATGAAFGGGVIHVGPNASLALFAGTISGGKVTAGDKEYQGRGGNIFLNSGYKGGVNYVSTFKMYGGEISRGSAAIAGGNVHVRKGCTFDLYAGWLRQGTVTTEYAAGGNGGSLSVEGTVNFYGGMIDASSVGGVTDAISAGNDTDGFCVAMIGSESRVTFNDPLEEGTRELWINGCLQAGPEGSLVTVNGGYATKVIVGDGNLVVTGGTVDALKLEEGAGTATFEGGFLYTSPTGSTADRVFYRGGCYGTEPEAAFVADGYEVLSVHVKDKGNYWYDYEVRETSHDLVHYDAQAPTCTNPGWEAYDACSRCNYTTYTEIPALGHEAGTEWKNDKTDHWQICTREGCGEILDKAAHTYNESGVCTVCGYDKSVIVGDADGDGETTDWDAVLLTRYLAGWDVTLNEALMDIDGDGETTDWDAVLLDRYLAGWDVVTMINTETGEDPEPAGPGDILIGATGLGRRATDELLGA